jgi:hypothetical protein
MTTEHIDWKPIALELAQRVNFAISHLTCKGAGLLLNTEDGTTQHWRDYMADAMEKCPGVTVNRELMHTFDLPRSQQKKAQAEIAKRQTEASNAK